jgi:hypothetical protein
MAIDMELEKVLRAPEVEQPPYPSKVITLANGKKMVVREVTREDVPTLLKAVHPTLFIHRDYYDIVGARLCGNSGWYTYRAKRVLPRWAGGWLPGGDCQWAHDG